MSRSRGFTLTDLLALVFAIALLFALPLPTFGGARESAQRVQCLSQQRQIVTASTSFAVDDRMGRVIPAWVNADGVSVQHTLNWSEAPAGDGRNGPFIPGVLELQFYGIPPELLADPGRDFEPFTRGARYVHAYQYFGGITAWFNVPNTTQPIRGLSPVTIDNLSLDVTFSADHVIRQDVDTAWGAATNEELVGSPAHRVINGQPSGGNHIYGDGSGEWVAFADMYQLHSWNDRQMAYFYQQDLGNYTPQR